MFKCPCGKYDFCFDGKCEALQEWLKSMGYTYEEAMNESQPLKKREINASS